MEESPARRNARFEKVVELVRTERIRQDRKWGWPQDNSLPEWMTILGEEFGELCQEVLRQNFGQTNRLNELVDEAAQVAAVAMAIIETLNYQGDYPLDIGDQISDVTG